MEAESHSRFYELLIEALNDRGSIYAIGLVTPIDFSFRGGSLSRSFYDRFTQADLSILNPANFIEAPFKVSLRIAGDSCFIIATVIGSALSLVRAPVKELNWSALAHLGVYAINYSTFLGGPINEEPGWRGFCSSKTPTTLRSVSGDPDSCPVVRELAHPIVLFARLGHGFLLAVLADCGWNFIFVNGGGEHLTV